MNNICQNNIMPLFLCKVLSLLCFIFSIIGCSSGSDYLFLNQSTENIKKEILVKTPIGSNLEVVNKFISGQQHMGIVSPPYQNSTGLKIRDKDDPQIITISGVHSIKLLLGRYNDPKWLFLFKIDVYASWGFNKDNEVINLRVHKYNRPS